MLNGAPSPNHRGTPNELGRSVSTRRRATARNVEARITLFIAAAVLPPWLAFRAAASYYVALLTR